MALIIFILARVMRPNDQVRTDKQETYMDRVLGGDIIVEQNIHVIDVTSYPWQHADQLVAAAEDNPAMIMNDRSVTQWEIPPGPPRRWPVSPIAAPAGYGKEVGRTGSAGPGAKQWFRKGGRERRHPG